MKNTTRTEQLDRITSLKFRAKTLKHSPISVWYFYTIKKEDKTFEIWSKKQEYRSSKEVSDVQITRKNKTEF